MLLLFGLRKFGLLFITNLGYFLLRHLVPLIGIPLDKSRKIWVIFAARLSFLEKILSSAREHQLIRHEQLPIV